MDELFGFPDDDSDADDSQEDEAIEDDDAIFIPDMARVAFLDQEAAAFAEAADEFEGIYGFRHECHCDQDYSRGAVGEITECYAGLCIQGLANCARLNYENKQLKSLAATLMEIQLELNNELVKLKGEHVGDSDQEEA